MPLTFLPSRRQRALAALRRAAARLEDSLLGDLIGALCLSAIVPLLLFIGLIFE